MIQENINFIRKSLERGNPEYGILSLTADSFDALRTYMVQEHLPDARRTDFNQAMNKILEGMTVLDQLLEEQ